MRNVLYKYSNIFLQAEVHSQNSRYKTEAYPKHLKRLHYKIVTIS
jgi:hypothetical protein